MARQAWSFPRTPARHCSRPSPDCFAILNFANEWEPRDASVIWRTSPKRISSGDCSPHSICRRQWRHGSHVRHRRNLQSGEAVVFRQFVFGAVGFDDAEVGQAAVSREMVLLKENNRWVIDSIRKIGK